MEKLIPLRKRRKKRQIGLVGGVCEKIEYENKNKSKNEYESCM